MIFTTGAIVICISMFGIVESLVIMRTAPNFILAMFGFFLLGVNSLALGWNISKYME